MKNKWHQAYLTNNMKTLREHIKREIKNLMEEKYPTPPEILGALEHDLKLKPIVRYVDTIKAVNSIPPSYEVFLHNTQSFTLSVAETAIFATINSKEYWLNDSREINEGIKELNRLLTQPLPPKIEDPESDEESFDNLDSGDTEMEPETGEEEIDTSGDG
jgi:hypothetical protein